MREKEKLGFLVPSTPPGTDAHATGKPYRFSFADEAGVVQVPGLTRETQKRHTRGAALQVFARKRERENP